MSDDLFDVIVVGAGPAGSCAAYELASRGHSVAVFETKGAPGLNACCTGIISAECFNSVGVSTDVILAQSKSAKFFSPAGRCLRLETEEVQAYVVDRALFDAAVATRAEARGARYFFSSTVTDVIRESDGMQVEVQCSGVRRCFNARVVVLANGCGPGLSRRLGLGRIGRFFVGAQAEVEVRDIDEVEVHFGRHIAPGSFAWLVPISEDRSYVGLLAGSNARHHLAGFLNRLSEDGKLPVREAQIRQKPIPLGTPGRSYADRVIAIGDSAGHVKPTTGGGIYFGHLGARMAGQVLDEALQDDDLSARRLALYEDKWKARIGRELRRGYMARWVYARLGDRQLERLFSVLDSTGAAEAMLRSRDFSFDWHGRLALAGLRRSSAYPWLRLRRFLAREDGS